MNNIVWQKPDSSYSITTIANGEDSATHAAELQASGAIPSNWTIYSTNAADLSPYTAPSAADLLAAYKSSAQIALEKADLTAIRIGEAVTLGLNSWTSADVIAWTNYRRDLRISLSAAIVGTLPTKPSYPAGT